jgi:hypothetical protein
MGIDITFYVEHKVKNKWELVEPTNEENKWDFDRKEWKLGRWYEFYALLDGEIGIYRRCSHESGPVRKEIYWPDDVSSYIKKRIGTPEDEKKAIQAFSYPNQWDHNSYTLKELLSREEDFEKVYPFFTRTALAEMKKIDDNSENVRCVFSFNN